VGPGLHRHGKRLCDARRCFADPVQPEFILPDVKDPKTWGGWDEAFMDKDHKYVFAARSYLKLPYFNAKLLSPDKVKRLGSKIFLDPELKGKVIWHEPLIPGSGRTFAPVMLQVLGEDGLRRFVQEQVVFTPNQMDAVDRRRGAVPRHGRSSPGCRSLHQAASARRPRARQHARVGAYAPAPRAPSSSGPAHPTCSVFPQLVSQQGRPTAMRGRRGHGARGETPPASDAFGVR
jgi:hypothetical protein